MSNASEPLAGRGRPRSETVRQRILDAAHDLLLQTGLTRLSMDAIAERAGSSKATVYRWWPDKNALALDALVEHAVREAVVFPDTGDLLADLRSELSTVGRVYTQTPVGGALLDIVARAGTDPALAAELRARVIGPACAAAKVRLQRAREAGDLRPGVDLDLVVNAVWGPVYHRLLVTGEPVTDAMVDELLDFLAPALAAG